MLSAEILTYARHNFKSALFISKLRKFQFIIINMLLVVPLAGERDTLVMLQHIQVKKYQICLHSISKINYYFKKLSRLDDTERKTSPKELEMQSLLFAMLSDFLCVLLLHYCQ